MACPTCGGTERATLAPGFYQCRSTVSTGAAPINPAVPGGPMRPVYGECGHRYQEGSPALALGLAPRCSCGMFAVGKCADDERWVCGSHGGIYGDGSFLCGDCWARRDDEARAARVWQAQKNFDAAPVPTVDLLGRIADGAEQCAMLRADFHITGAQLAAFMRRRVEPKQIDLSERDEQATRIERKRRKLPGLTVWKQESGWELENDHYRDTKKYLLLDGRQLLLTRNDSNSYVYDPSYHGPNNRIEFDLLRPVLRLNFPRFREIDWLLGDSGRVVGVVTASGRHESV